jgi:hypothetical protein
MKDQGGLPVTLHSKPLDYSSLTVFEKVQRQFQNEGKAYSTYSTNL